MRKPPPDPWRSGVWIAFVLALGTTAFGVIFLGHVMRTEGAWVGWYPMTFVIVAASWTGAWAWRRRRWVISTAMFTLTLFAPWAGFIIAPLVSFGLVIASIAALVRERKAQKV